MSPVPGRYIRAIYLLPGVKCGSQAKREKRCFASSGKRGQLLSIMWYSTAVLLMQVEVMYSGPVVIMF